MYRGEKEDFDNDKAEYITAVQPVFEKLNLWLEQVGTGCGAGPSLSAVDFVLWELLDIHLTLEPTILDQHFRLTDFHRNVRSHPRLAQYFASERARSGLNGPIARWNSGGTGN